MELRRLILGISIVVASSNLAIADVEPGEPRYELLLDGTIAAVGAAGWIASERLVDLSPSSCRWCASNVLDAGARNSLRWSDPEPAHKASNVAAFVATPVCTLSVSLIAAVEAGDRDEILEDGLILAEATAVGAIVHQIVKFSVAREQPYAHDLTPEERVRRGIRHRNTSFYSGHTASAFTIAVGAGTLAAMRGYDRQEWVWGVGLAAATTTGYLRLASDRHYLTDVLAGAAIGSAIGLIVPYYLHPPSAPQLEAPAMTPTAFSVGSSW